MNPVSPGMPTGEEIDQRLRLVGQLRNLCLSLGKARILKADLDNDKTSILDTDTKPEHLVVQSLDVDQTSNSC